MFSKATASLQQELLDLRRRVSALEDTLAGHGLLPSPQPEAAAPASTPPPALPLATGPVLPPPPPPAFVSLSAAQPGPSLENRIGSEWFNRVGILAVLIGMALFLKLAISNHWVGPLGRVLVGLVAGAAFIAWSERLRHRGYAVFSYSLKALGSGILYLSLWAAFSLFHLLPAGVAFAAMALITLFNGYMAWAQNAELLAVLSLTGGLGTPLLVSTGGNHQLTLFSYLLMLDLAVLALTVLRPWSRLLVGAFAGTMFFFVGWWFRFYTPTESTRTALFTLAFFLLFAIAPTLPRIAPRAGTPSRWDALAHSLLPIANATFGFVSFLTLLTSQAYTLAGIGPWLAVAFAAFYLLLRHLAARSPVHPGAATVSEIHLSLSIIFLVLAIPLKTQGRWLTLGWLTEGTVLLTAAQRLRSQLLRTFALFCLALGLTALLAVASNPASRTPLLNARFSTFASAIAAFAFVAHRAHRASQTAEDSTYPLSWTATAATAILLVNLLALVALGLEVHSFWWYRRWSGHLNQLSEYKILAQFSYSALFMLYGALLLTLGIWRRSAFVRWQALILLALSIAKVFLVDVRELSQGYSVLSFLGLGALLLAVSFLYQRDWLHLRHPNEPHA